MTDDIPVSEMRSMPDHHPRRDDQVAAWLKHRRDTMECGVYEGPEIVDTLLDIYREAADTGMSLEEVVNGEHTPQPTQLKPRRSPR